MPLIQPFPGHTLKATFDDIRRDLEGLIVRDAAGKPRAGVFPDHTGELFTRQNNMTIGVKAFRAAQVRGGVVLLSNDGVTMVTIPPAPSANRRIDLVYVTARSTAAPWSDTADTPTFGVQQGVASATPVAPTLPANLADALPLFTVETAAAATTTQAAIITQVFPYTAAAGGVVLVRNLVELAAWQAGDGARARNLATGRVHERQGTVWVCPSMLAEKYGSGDPMVLNTNAETDITGLFLEFELGKPCTVQLEAFVSGMGGAANNVSVFKFREGPPTVYASQQRQSNASNVAATWHGHNLSARVRDMPAGSHRIALTIQRTAGTGALTTSLNDAWMAASIV